MKFGKCLSNNLLILANICFVIIFSYSFLRILIHTTEIIPANPMKYVVGTLLYLGLIISVIPLSKYTSQVKRRKGIIVSFVLALEFLYVWAIYSQVDSDAYVINYIAYNFAKGDLGALEGFWKQYLATYTNNIPATVIIALIYAAWIPNSLENSWFLLSVIAMALANLAVFSIYKLAKYLLGKKAAIISLIFSVPLILLSEPSTILYSDIMILWTTPMALYLIAMHCKNKKFRHLAVAAVLLAIGAWIKVQSIIVVIATCIVLVLNILHVQDSKEFSHNTKRLLLFCGVFFITFMSLQNITNTAVRVIGEEYVRENKMPAIHFVAMGLNPESNGAYSLEDVQNVMDVLGPDKKVQMCSEKICTRLKEFGVKGLITHLDQKIIWGAGRGTFTSGREWRGALLNNTLQAQRIQQWSVVHNSLFDNYTAVFIQCGYLMVFFCSIHSATYMLSGKRREQDKGLLLITNMCRIAMIGIFFMLLLLERNLRYMYAMLPCMIILCSYDLNKLLSDKS